MDRLDSQIDDLYHRPLDEFIEARAALASQLKGDEARRVKQLKKPTAVPWAVNQVYWHARPLFDRVMTSGKALRLAQIAALEGRSTDVRAATKTHRDAVAAAVAKAIEIAGAANAQPGRDLLAQTFEALSLAPAPPSGLGRLTQPMQPGGFEMLTGVEPAATVRPSPPPHERPHVAGVSAKSGRSEGGKPEGVEKEKGRTKAAARAEARQAAEAERARKREAEAAARQRAAAIKEAEAALARAQTKEAEAERAWRQAQKDVETARRALRTAQS